MGKFSFKTHDPFIILEHLDGKLPVHAASLIMCLYRRAETMSPTYTRHGFIDEVNDLIIVHTVNIICQQLVRIFVRQESAIIKDQIEY